MYEKKHAHIFPKTSASFPENTGMFFYFFVQKIRRYYLSILNQSMSAQPPSLVVMAGRVQNVPTLAPIHLPSFT